MSDREGLLGYDARDAFALALSGRYFLGLDVVSGEKVWGQRAPRSGVDVHKFRGKAVQRFPGFDQPPPERGARWHTTAATGPGQGRAVQWVGAPFVPVAGGRDIYLGSARSVMPVTAAPKSSPSSVSLRR